MRWYTQISDASNEKTVTPRLVLIVILILIVIMILMILLVNAILRLE